MTEKKFENNLKKPVNEQRAKSHIVRTFSVIWKAFLLSMRDRFFRFSLASRHETVHVGILSTLINVLSIPRYAAAGVNLWILFLVQVTAADTQQTGWGDINPNDCQGCVIVGMPGSGILPDYLNEIAKIVNDTRMPLIVFGSRQRGHNKNGGPIRWVPDPVTGKGPSDVDLGCLEVDGIMHFAGSPSDPDWALKGLLGKVPVEHGPMAIFDPHQIPYGLPGREGGIGTGPVVGIFPRGYRNGYFENKNMNLFQPPNPAWMTNMLAKGNGALVRASGGSLPCGSRNLLVPCNRGMPMKPGSGQPTAFGRYQTPDGGTKGKVFTVITTADGQQIFEPIASFQSGGGGARASRSGLSTDTKVAAAGIALNIGGALLEDYIVNNYLPSNIDIPAGGFTNSFDSNIPFMQAWAQLIVTRNQVNAQPTDTLLGKPFSDGKKPSFWDKVVAALNCAGQNLP